MAGALVLIGLSGSGKSTVGRLLAARLDLPLVDTDRLVEQWSGRTVAEVFAQEGEPAFRALEREAVCVACADAAVVSVGGGAVLREMNRRAMRRGNLVAWLDVPVPVLASRLASHRGDEERPLLRGDLETRLRALWRARRPLYAQTAHLRIGWSGADSTGPPALAAALNEIYRTWKGQGIRQ